MPLKAGKRYFWYLLVALIFFLYASLQLEGLRRSSSFLLPTPAVHKEWRRRRGQRLNISLPILILSLPKSGTTSLARYFTCGGVPAGHTHFFHNNGTWFRLGDCLRDNFYHNRPLLYGCGHYKVWADMGVVKKDQPDQCFYPSLHALERIAHDYPHATLLVSRRRHWFRSARGWSQLVDRWAHHCPAVFPNQTNDEQVWQQFYKASPEDQAEALRRYETIKPYLDGTPPETETVSSRTIRDWKSKYLAAQKQYNCGLIGLLSHRNSKGNRSRKLPQETIDLIDKVILEDYETNKQKNMLSSYRFLVELCDKKGAFTPSYVTFTKQVQQRSSYKQTKKRQGRRAAYKHKEFYWELNKTTPRHGDRPFEIGHIDHTELDIELVCSKTGRNLGRPWATFFNDAYSRKILAVYLTLDPPSYRSCLMALRICVKRHGRLPQIIVVDNGSEFNSTYFETLLATFEITKKQRPPAQARFGSVCERLFGTSNTQFVYNLQGNTQITRNVRQVTKSVNPKNQAIWTLAFLYDYLCHWAYEIYDTIDHPALHQSPREAFAQGMLQSGNRSHRMIPYNKDFCMLTLPTTSKGKAKVQPGNGVKINYIYYWSNQFRDPEIEKTLVPIRYDPFNVGIAYAYVKGQWVECISQYYADFQGHTEKELKLASSEIRKRNQNHTKNNKISAKKLANFLASAEAQEALFKQRTNDLETQQVLQIVEGKVKPLSQHQNQTIQQQEVESKSSQSSITVEFKEVREPESTENEAPEEFDLDELEIYEEF